MENRGATEPLRIPLPELQVEDTRPCAEALVPVVGVLPPILPAIEFVLRVVGEPVEDIMPCVVIGHEALVLGSLELDEVPDPLPLPSLPPKVRLLRPSPHRMLAGECGKPLLHLLQHPLVCLGELSVLGRAVQNPIGVQRGESFRNLESPKVHDVHYAEGLLNDPRQNEASTPDESTKSTLLPTWQA